MRRAASAPEHHRAKRDRMSHGCKPVENQHRESIHIRRNRRRETTVATPWGKRSMPIGVGRCAIIGGFAEQHGLTPVAVLVAAWTPAASCSEAQASCAQPCCWYGVHWVGMVAHQAYSPIAQGISGLAETKVVGGDGGVLAFGCVAGEAPSIGNAWRTDQEQTPAAQPPGVVWRGRPATGFIREHRL